MPSMKAKGRKGAERRKYIGEGKEQGRNTTQPRKTIPKQKINNKYLIAPIVLASVSSQVAISFLLIFASFNLGRN